MMSLVFGPKFMVMFCCIPHPTNVIKSARFLEESSLNGNFVSSHVEGTPDPFAMLAISEAKE
jgi:hypothetical protein